MTNLKISKKKKSGVKLVFIASDPKRLDEAIKKCCETISKTGGHYRSLVRMPNKLVDLMSLNRSPHIYNCAKDQYKRKVVKAILSVNPSLHTLSALKELVICAGVYVDMIVNNEEINND